MPAMLSLKESYYSPIESERRRIGRPRFEVSREWSAIWRSGDQIGSGEIMDLNFAGARIGLLVPSDSIGANIDGITIRFGTAPFGKIKSARVIWRLEGQLGVEFKTDGPEISEYYEAPVYFPAYLRPVLHMRDPIRPERLLFFQVHAIVGLDLLVETSLANRHLLPGMMIEEGRLLLPGISEEQVGISIERAEYREGRMALTVRWDQNQRSIVRAIQQMKTLGSESLFPTAASARRIIQRVRRIRSASAIVRVDPVSDPKEYKALLGVRLRAYAAANIIAPTIQDDEMADDLDRRSLILVARCNGVVLGTGRLIYCLTEDQRFLFEKDIPFEALNAPSRRAFVEVSRLAVEPALQGTSIMGDIIKEVARSALVDGMKGICLGRTVQRKSYAKYGFSLASKEIPHPRLAGQTLALMTCSAEDFLSGKAVSPAALRSMVPDVTHTLRIAGVLTPSNEGRHSMNVHTNTHGYRSLSVSRTPRPLTVQFATIEANEVTY